MAKQPSSNAAQRVRKKSPQEHCRRYRSRSRFVQQHHHHHHRPSGQRSVVGFFRWPGLQGFAQVDALRCPGGFRSGRSCCDGTRHQEPRRRDQGPWPWPRIVCARSGRPGHPHHIHFGCDTGSAQRLPPAKASSYLSFFQAHRQAMLASPGSRIFRSAAV